MQTIDISMPLFEGMPRLPDDPPFGSEPLRALRKGDPYALSLLRFGSHAGTHLDPPRHFFESGAAIDGLDLEALLGPCTVVDVRPEGRTIRPSDLGSLPTGTSRVLLRTPNSARWARRLEYFEEFTALDVRAAEALVARGVRLVGIDALSVEDGRDPSFPVHRTLLASGVAVLEGLLLGDVAPGPYELLCLPLPLRNGDGGPARAVLRRSTRGPA